MLSNHRLLRKNQSGVREGSLHRVSQGNLKPEPLKVIQKEEFEDDYWVEWWNGIRESLQGYPQSHVQQSDRGYNEAQRVNQQFWKKIDEMNSPQISARSWVVVDGQTGRMIWGKNEHNRKEVASLTKIMTCYVTLQLLEKLKIDPYNTYIQVSAYASQVGGTTANLKENDVLTVNDLLHGMMLPSGNDAASALAENFGVYLYFQSKEFMIKYGNQEVIQNLKILCPAKYFVSEMNETALRLGLQNSYYGNAHGLTNKLARSSAFDVAKLCHAAMKIPYFQQLVNMRSYSCQILNEGVWRELQWENTNRLLDFGYQGVKTGITNEAGPCLASFFKTKNAHYLIVILNSSSKDERWVDTCKLVEWVSKLYEH